MFGMAMQSAKQFFTGKLFKDNHKVMQHFALGAAGGALIGIALGQVAPLWVAALVAGAVAGFAQPILLKNVKYA
jgi:uncharacterized membrane protein YoaK (UPF0700 family)